MCKLVITLAITFLYTVNGYSQFNLGKVKDKVKKETEKDKKTEETKTTPAENGQQGTNTNTPNEKQNPVATRGSVTPDQLAAGPLGNGKYFSTEPGIKYIEISNFCEAGPVKLKIFRDKGSMEITYKKSYYANGLFYYPEHDNFIYIYKEKNVILTFEAHRSDVAKVHTIKAVDALSMDEKIKSVAPDSYRDKVVEVLAEQAKNKDADDAAEYKKRMDARQAPVDLMKNPELTKAALTCINNQAIKDKYGYTFTKAYIISEDWAIFKNQYTGAIIKRTAEVAVLRTKDGKCFLESFSIGQDYTGSGFQKTLFFNGVLMKIGFANEEIDCNKVK